MIFLKKNWPLWISMAILFYGMQLFFQKYPNKLPVFKSDQAQNLHEDSLDRLLTQLTRDTVFSSLTFSDTLSRKNPFHSDISLNRVVNHSNPVELVKLQPMRSLKLKGTAGNQIASLIDSLGVKHLMKVGDSIAGIRILEIRSDRVFLQDASGKFELTPQP